MKLHKYMSFLQMYSLHVHELGGARGDDVPPIQRRYTDFLKLHGTLMKKFPLTVSEFAFPKKLLSGKAHINSQFLSLMDKC